MFPLLLLSLLAQTASAADYLESWVYDGWQNDVSMVGVDGWVGGYDSDEWIGYTADSGQYGTS